MQIPSHPPFEIVPGVGIGPFLLAMTEEEIGELCRQHGLRNEGVLRGGLSVQFKEGRAVRIDVGCDVGLSLAGEPLIDDSDDNVRRLLATLAPPGQYWTEMDGLVATHWEFGDREVFSFMVYAPGHRFTTTTT
jgi:hypothetical protein